jgi:hypothetical protein
MDDLSFAAIDAQLDHLERKRDEIECDMLVFEVLRRRPWLKPIQEAVHELVERHFQRWKRKSKSQRPK